jgi:uncharacterized membrane protein YozB (DUF420 family)
MTDLGPPNLSFQLLIFVLAILGVILILRRSLVKHCRLLNLAIILNLISVFVVMVPSFFQFTRALTLAGLRSLEVLIMMTHGAVGTVALILSVVVVLRMTNRVPTLARIAPAMSLMRVTFLLWLLSLLMGLMIYRSIYIQA